MTLTIQCAECGATIEKRSISFTTGYKLPETKQQLVLDNVECYECTGCFFSIFSQKQSELLQQKILNTFISANRNKYYKIQCLELELKNEKKQFDDFLENWT